MNVIQRALPFLLLALCVAAFAAPFVVGFSSGQSPLAIPRLSNDVKPSCDTYEPNSNMYATCRLEIISKETIFSDEPITCDNMYVYEDNCLHLQTVQKARMTKDPSACTAIGPTFGNQPTSEFAMCIGQFPGSNEWKKGCAAIEESVRGYGNVAGNTTSILVRSRCLTKDTADIQYPGSGNGHSPFDRYGDTYKAHSEALGRDGIYNPYAPAWFDELRGWTKKDYDYLKSIGADPNATDDFGRTALVLEIQERLYLNDYIDQNFDNLPRAKQPAAAEKGVENMKLLIGVGTDPRKEDILHLSAIDYASQLRNDIFRQKALEVLGGASAASASESGWMRFDKASYGFSFMYPDYLVPGSPEYSGATWISFHRRDDPLGLAPVSVIIGETNVPLSTESQSPIYDSCVKGKQWLVGVIGEKMELKLSKEDVNGTAIELLSQVVDGKIEAAFLLARSGGSCYVIRAMGPGYGNDGMGVADFTKIG